MTLTSAFALWLLASAFGLVFNYCAAEVSEGKDS